MCVCVGLCVWRGGHKGETQRQKGSNKKSMFKVHFKIMENRHNDATDGKN